MSESQVENGARNGTSAGVRIHGLIEETKRMNKENEGSPKMMHDSSMKAPTRVSNSEFHNLSNLIDDKAGQGQSNWVEYRAIGKCPERRAYHASFIHNNW